MGFSRNQNRDSDWEMIAGKKDQLVGQIQERYGVAKEEAERQADEWSRALKETERESAPTTSLQQSRAGTKTAER